MPSLNFTSNLLRHVAAPLGVSQAETVRAVLEDAFAVNPALRGYVLDDQGRVRKHVTIFVNGAPIRDRNGQQDRVNAADEVFVMQALSGG